MSKSDRIVPPLIPTKEPVHKCIVRVTTSAWQDNNGVYVKKSLKFLKRQCVGYNILYEDAHMSGAEMVVDHITNLYSCEDGMYQVVTCNERSDWETPNIIEEYDYKLVPLENI